MPRELELLDRSTSDQAGTRARGGWLLFATLTAFLSLFLVGDPVGVIDKANYRPLDGYSFTNVIAPTIGGTEARPFFYPLVKKDGAPYLSQAGLHGRALHHLRKLWPGSDQGFYRAAEVATGTAFAAVLAALLCLALPSFGIVATLATAVALAISPFLICVATDLYWIPALTFLPMLVAWGLYPRVQRRETSLLVLCAAAASAAALKFLCGYEFVSVVLVAPLFAIPFYEPARRWPTRAILMRASLLAASLLAGFLLALGLHALQAYALFDTNVLHHLRDSGSSRSFGSAYMDYVVNTLGPGQRDLLIRRLAKIWAWCGGDPAGLARFVSHLVSQYWALGVITILEYFTFTMVGYRSHARYYYTAPFAHGLEFAHVLALQLVALAAIGLLKRRNESLGELGRLGVVSLATLLAPCSWFVLGFGHSVIHSFIIPSVFFLPWGVLSLLFVTSAATRLVRRVALARWQRPSAQR
jgi:hypothetical protein